MKRIKYSRLHILACLAMGWMAFGLPLVHARFHRHTADCSSESADDHSSATSTVCFAIPESGAASAAGAVLPERPCPVCSFLAQSGGGKAVLREIWGAVPEAGSAWITMPVEVWQFHPGLAVLAAGPRAPPIVSFHYQA